MGNQECSRGSQMSQMPEKVWKRSARKAGGSCLPAAANRRPRAAGPGYIYAWGPRIKNWPTSSSLKQLDRKGQPCKLLARGAMNSALVRFADGLEAVISRNALRRIKVTPCGPEGGGTDAL